MERSTAPIKAQFIQTWAIPLQSVKLLTQVKLHKACFWWARKEGRSCLKKDESNSTWGTGYAVSHRVKPAPRLPTSWKSMDTQVIKPLLEKLFL